MELDLILEETGGFGRVQFLVLAVLLPLTMSFGSFSYWSQLLILLVPDHHCRVPQGTPFDNLTAPGQCHISKTLQETTSDFAYQNNAVQDPWFSYSGWSSLSSAFESNNLTSSSCEYGWEYDFTSMYPTVATQNNWVCDESWKVFFTHTIYWLGSTIGFLLNGFLLDRFGRWKMLLSLLLIQTVASVSTIFTAGIFPLFCAMRFLSGLAGMPMQSTSYTLAVEMMTSSKRKIVGVSTAIYWLLAAAAFPWIAVLLNDWKLLVVFAASPGPILLIFMKFVPESPSWLLSTGEIDQAFRVFGYIRKMNTGVKSYGLEKMKEMIQSTSSSEKKESMLKTTLSMLKMPNMRKKTICIFLAWFSVCMAYHGNNLGQSSTGTNVFLLYSLGSLLEIPVCFIYLVTVDTFGRKPPILISLLLVAVLAPFIHLINLDATWLRFGMNIIIRGLFSLGYNVLFQLGCEIFPTPLRGRGVFLMRTVGDIGTSTAPFILNSNAVWPLLSSVVFSILSLVCCCLTLTLPETLGQPLPQTLKEADQFGQDQPVLPFTIPCCHDRNRNVKVRCSTTDLISASSRSSVSDMESQHGASLHL